jgi:predicted DCC family thiol-disulfide oxidoreductase YuxK
MSDRDLKKSDPRSWVLYDDQCGFCSRWVQFWGPTLAKRRIGIAGLQEPWVRELLHLGPEELLSDIRLSTQKGEMYSGSDVYLQVTRRIWWAWPFYAVFSLPGFNKLLQIGYRWFARNRYCVSHICKLSPGGGITSTDSMREFHRK